MRGETVDVDGRAFRGAAPQVVADVVDDEVIVVDLASGRYHRLEGAGARVWVALAAGAVPPVQGPASELVATLLAEGLVVAVDAPQDAPPWPELGDDGSLHLDSFDDLADMLLLDPIHDVDPVHGWPTAVEDV